MYLSRKPVEALWPSIASLWYSNRQLVTQAREFALPTGSSPTFAKLSLRGAFGRLSIGVWRIYFLDERSVGIQRSRSKALTALRWSAVKTGASITVAGRPGPFVPTRTKVAFISASVFIVPPADFWFSSVRRARLTSIQPITVAKVCNRKELWAHWCEGPFLPVRAGFATKALRSLDFIGDFVRCRSGYQ